MKNPKRNKYVTRISIVLAVIMILTAVFSVGAVASNVGGKSVSSQGAAVIDFETGLLLYGYNENVSRVPASMIKMLTIYVIFDAIEAGEISLDTVTKISKGVSEFSNDRTFSNIRLAVNQEVTIGQLLNIVILRSANAATVALAEALSDSEAAFVTRMRNKLRELEIEGRVFDSFGGSPDNAITPAGMAELSRHLIFDHPQILKLTSLKSVEFEGAVYTNTNALLSTYPGIDGLKTGFTTPAGYCFTGTAIRDGRRIIAVTMGSTQALRFPDTEILLDYGFAVADEVIAAYFGDTQQEENPIEDAPIRATAGSVYPSGANLLVDGVAVPLNAFIINDYHYFKLRDIAYLINGTEKQFNVTWDETDRTISIAIGEHYIAVGGETQTLDGESRRFSTTSSTIFVDGEVHEFDAYLIGDNNYFMLRELAALVGFGVDWDDETRTVILSTVAFPVS